MKGKAHKMERVTPARAIRYRSIGGGWEKSAYIEHEIKKRLKVLARLAE